MWHRPIAYMASLILMAGTASGVQQRGVVDARPATPSAVADASRGDRVMLDGEVIRILDTNEFRLADGTGSIPVHLPWSGSSLVSVGDRVTIKGIVNDEMTFGISRPAVYAMSIRLPGGASIEFNQTAEDASTVETAVPTSTDRATPVAIGTLRRGQSATITGRVDRILDTDEFRLVDETGSVRVYAGWRHRLTVQVGDRVTITGTMDDDPWPMPAEFYASSITPAGAETILLEPAHPQDATAAVERPPQTDGVIQIRERTPIASLEPYQTVLVEGVVERITDEDEFRIRDDSGSVRVYIGWRNRMPVAVGERAQVVGIVDSGGPAGLFREIYAYEITTATSRVTDLQRARASAVPPATPQVREPAPAGPSIVEIRSVRRGQTVALQGEVSRIRDTDEFVLRDSTGTIQIYIGWRNQMPVAVGDRVTVFGTADDDVFPGTRPEIYADRIVLPNGTTIHLVRGGYDD